MIKKIFPSLIGCIAAVLIVTGCKSPAVVSDKVKESEIEESISAYRQVIVEVQQGTEEVQPTIEEIEPVGEETEPIGEEIEPIPESVQTAESGIQRATEYYSVQIGAFEEQLNAEQAFQRARQLFDLEAINEYDPVEQLFKITVGKFTLYEDAQIYRDRIMRDYPYEFSDAWIVDMAQRKYQTIY
jgi:cell division septation protein DedD